MSAISRELLEQQGNMEEVIRKLFPDAPVIDSSAECRKIEAELRDARAMAILAHVRELGSDY